MTDLFSLFDPPPPEPQKPKTYPLEPRLCPHRNEDKTETFWTDIQQLRMTWTCRDCGNIRGRV